MPAAAAAMNNDMNMDQDSYHKMCRSRNPWGHAEFPMVPEKSSYDHAVLYKNKSGSVYDKWERGYVKMPYSKKNLYENLKGKGHETVTRWEVIQKALRKPIRDSRQLEKAIFKYNQKFEWIWKFHGLHKFFAELSEEQAEHYFQDTLPFMIDLALKLPELIRDPIPMLEKNANRSISLSQMQIASLLANAFFCTFPRRNDQGPNTEYRSYPKINFSSLFETASDGAVEKLKCIFNYFERIRSDKPDGVVTFCRRHVRSFQLPKWEGCDVKIGSVEVQFDDQHKIEDMDGYIQVDFANKYLGGGVLGSGCVQEEIRFVICPELMAAMLFTEVLDDSDAVLVLGCERFSSYTGYGREGFKFAGNYIDTTPRDGSKRRRTAVLAIDAIEFQNEKNQFTYRNLKRELNKAWIGFSFYTDPSQRGANYPGVATGNWGCGAFGGSPQLKSLLQIAAAAVARRPLVYLTFGDAQFKRELTEAYEFLRNVGVTVGDLCHLVPKYYNVVNKGDDLLTFLQKALIDQNSDLEDCEPDFMDASPNPTFCNDERNSSPYIPIPTENYYHQKNPGSHEDHAPVHSTPDFHKMSPDELLEYSKRRSEKLHEMERKVREATTSQHDGIRPSSQGATGMFDKFAMSSSADQTNQTGGFCAGGLNSRARSEERNDADHYYDSQYNTQYTGRRNDNNSIHQINQTGQFSGSGSGVQYSKGKNDADHYNHSQYNMQNYPGTRNDNNRSNNSSSTYNHYGKTNDHYSNKLSTRDTVLSDNASSSRGRGRIDSFERQPGSGRVSANNASSSRGSGRASSGLYSALGHGVRPGAKNQSNFDNGQSRANSSKGTSYIAKHQQQSIANSNSSRPSTDQATCDIAQEALEIETSSLVNQSDTEQNLYSSEGPTTIPATTVTQVAISTIRTQNIDSDWWKKGLEKVKVFTTATKKTDLNFPEVPAAIITTGIQNTELNSSGIPSAIPKIGTRNSDILLSEVLPTAISAIGTQNTDSDRWAKGIENVEILKKQSENKTNTDVTSIDNKELMKTERDATNNLVNQPDNEQSRYSSGVAATIDSADLNFCTVPCTVPATIQTSSEAQNILSSIWEKVTGKTKTQKKPITEKTEKGLMGSSAHTKSKKTFDKEPTKREANDLIDMSDEPTTSKKGDGPVPGLSAGDQTKTTQNKITESTPNEHAKAKDTETKHFVSQSADSMTSAQYEGRNSPGGSGANHTTPTENLNLFDILSPEALKIWYHGVNCGCLNIPCTVAPNSLSAYLTIVWYIGFIYGYIEALRLAELLFKS